MRTYSLCKSSHLTKGKFEKYACCERGKGGGGCPIKVNENQQRVGKEGVRLGGGSSLSLRSLCERLPHFSNCKIKFFLISCFAW